MNDAPAGTAVIVAPGQALTCAHVVARKSGDDGPWEIEHTKALRLRFRQCGVTLDLNPMTDVIIPGADDVAVLTFHDDSGSLPTPVALYPNRSAPPKVGLFGFPTEDDTEEGTWRDFTVVGPTASLVQLKRDEAAGSLPGHSGGAVLDLDSGCLVGLLQAGSTKGVFDRYLPIWRIADGWSRLRMPWCFAGLDARAHVEGRGRGRLGSTVSGEFFRGRNSALKKIRDWLEMPDDPGRVLVVTGQPGAGKSAVLSRAVLDAEPVYTGAGIVFHARQSTHAEFCQALARFVGAGVTDSGTELVRALSGLSREKLFVFVDALDEAPSQRDRHDLAATLRNMAKLSGVRVVVATRPLSAGSRFDTGAMLPRLGVTSSGADHLIDLDCEPFRDSAAVIQFVHAILQQDQVCQPRPPGAAWAYYRDHAYQTSRLARIIAGKADDNFLVSALAATSLAEGSAPLDPDDPADVGAIPSSVGEAFDKYFDSLDEATRSKQSVLLQALAYAKGAGIADDLWLRFASAVSSSPFTGIDLRSLRSSAIVDFLLETTVEADRTVTRLFHQALVDQLRETSRGDQAMTIFEVVVDQARTHGWAKTDGYIRTFAADHAADAGRLPQLLDDLDFVVNADPDRLLSAIILLPTPQRPPIVRVVKQAAGRLSDQTALQRASYLSLMAAHLGLPDLAQGLHARAETRVHPTWAHSLGTPHQPLMGHTEVVRSVAVGRLSGQDVIVSGSDDRTVRLWDTTGHPIGDPLKGHTGPVYSVAVGRLSGQDVVVSGSYDGTVRVWDAAGQSVGAPLEGHDGSVNAVAIGRLGGQDVIVSGGNDHMVRLWDAAGQLIGKPLEGHTDGVSAVAVGRFGDPDVVVSVGNRTVRLWDAAGHPIGEPLTGHTGDVWSVAIGRLGDQDVIASACEDGMVRLWGATPEPPGGPLKGHVRGVNAVAIGRLGDQDIVVTGGDDLTVRLWGADGCAIGDPLRGHTGWVMAVAIGRLGDQDVIVTGGADMMVRLWDSTGHMIGGSPLAGHTGPVTALMAGRLDGEDVIVSCSEDHTVRLWGNDGCPKGEPLRGPDDYVNTVAIGQLGGQDVIVSGSGDHMIRLWDATKHLIGDPLTGHTAPVGAVAIGKLGDQDVIASGGYDATVRLWDVTGRPIGGPLKGHTGWVRTVAIGQLGGQSVIVSGGYDGTVRLWNAARSLIGDPLEGHNGGVYAVAIGRLGDRDIVVSGSADGTVRLWDDAGRSIGDPLEGHADGVSAVAIGRLGDESVIVSGGWDGTVRLWGSDGQQIDEPVQFQDSVRAVMVGAKGIIVAAGIAAALIALDGPALCLDAP